MSAQDDFLAAFGERPDRKQDADGDESRGAGVRGDGPVEVRTEAGSEAGSEASGLGADDAAGVDSSSSEQRDPQGTAEPGEPSRSSDEPRPGEQPSAVAEATDDSGAPRPETEAAPTEAASTEAADDRGASAPEAATLIEAAPPEAAFAAPNQPYLDPAAFFTQLQAEAAAQPKPKRRWPRLVLRYAAALLVAGAVGAGTAYAVTLPRRTDVPFLATPTDGRYDFPPFVVRPAPPVGKPAPGADANGGQVHYDDLRQYLVPVPRGAVLKEDGWEPVADFEAGLAGSGDITGPLADGGVRHIAWRGWTTLDGQHVVVELLQFPDHQAAYSVLDKLSYMAPQKVGRGEAVVPQLTVPSLGDTTVNVAMNKFDNVAGLPGQMARRVVFQSGDVIAIVASTAPKRVTDVPTEQVVLLEGEMLR